jgi:uncharacterized protein (TIGR00730 family)
MFNLEEELAKKHFRVTIFGSARTKKGEKEYDAVHKLAFKCGQNGYDVVTGGGPGSMQAANEGHQEGKADSDADSVGLVIKLPWETGSNEFLDIETKFEKFSERLDTFMILSNVAVITYGGLGTCLELFYAWQLSQVKHICAMPIILMGEMWEELIEWVKKNIIDTGRADEKDLHNIFVVKSIDQAMDVINKAYEVYEKEGENYCLNYKKYKLD